MQNKKILDFPKINERAYEYQLDNGLKLVIIKKSGYKKYFAAFSTSFGGNDYEFLDKDTSIIHKLPYGTAHFLEHKAFEMKDGGDVSMLFSMLGVNSNAYTYFYNTCYFIDGYKNYNEALNLLIDFVQSPSYTKQSINKEKGIILQEYKATLDSPNNKITKQVKKNLYNVAFTKEILGNITSISNMKIDDINLAYNTFYHPSNMTLCIIGDVNIDETVKLVAYNQNKKTFSKRPNVEKIKYIENKKVKKKSILYLDIPSPIVNIALRIDKENTKKNEFYLFSYKVSILLQKLCGTFSYAKEEMVQKGIIISSMYDFQDGDPRYSYAYFSAKTNKPNEYISYMKKLIAGINDLVISEDEFEILKKAVIGSSILKLNDITELAFSYIDYENANCNYFECIEEIKKLKVEDIYEVKKYFDMNNMTIVLAMPINNH